MSLQVTLVPALPDKRPNVYMILDNDKSLKLVITCILSTSMVITCILSTSIYYLCLYIHTSTRRMV